MKSIVRPMLGALASAVLVGGFAAMTIPASVRADEGMWLFNRPPRALLKARYGFEPTDAWLEHLQKASVRFNSGGSGCFVSEDGLVMSNHHVGADAIQKLSTKEKDFLKDGFLARTLAEEKQCLDLELNVLMSIEDVTERVNAAVKSDLSPEAAFAARRAVMAEIEKESLDRTGLRSDVVTLYQGGAYHLYRFKKYTDVRLVFAPEQQIAFFGGDPDNFEYPRYCLDVCFFRAYENGQPARVPHHLRWSAGGPTENELVFVSGHPGRTSRLFTVAETEYLRDVRYPWALRRLHNLEVLLTAFSARSAENARRAKDDLFGAQNSRKAFTGMLAGVLEPAFMETKRAEEKRLRDAVSGQSRWAEAQSAWDRISAAQQEIARQVVRYNLIEVGHALNSKSFEIARTLLRAGAERPKPNGERLREFVESGRESLEFQLFSEEPIYEDLEQLKLADSLTFMVAQLGLQDATVQAALAGQSPVERARALIAGTKVRDVALRRKLYQGGASAVDAARDPMIELARSVDAEARRVRKIVETQNEIKQQAHGQLAKVRFALDGLNQYPDATFTLRLAFGTAKGYVENDRPIPFQTTFSGLFERAEAQSFRPPFDLPERWVKAKRRLDLNTPFNFVNTADIIGGNSGSPVVNRAGEVVGLIFDGNIQSLVLDLGYTEVQGRAIAVHSRSIVEALRKVYDARKLADELIGKKGKDPRG